MESCWRFLNLNCTILACMFVSIVKITINYFFFLVVLWNFYKFYKYLGRDKFVQKHFWTKSQICTKRYLNTKTNNYKKVYIKLKRKKKTKSLNNNKTKLFEAEGLGIAVVV